MNDAQHRVLVMHGPNLSLLGTREPALYGTRTLDQIHEMLHHHAALLHLSLETFQSNHEGALIDRLHAARENTHGVILNAGGYTHTSVALRDAVVAVGLPTIEVHLSNTLSREAFRHTSLIGPVCVGRIEGLGPDGYLLALVAMALRLGSVATRDASASMHLPLDSKPQRV